MENENKPICPACGRGYLKEQSDGKVRCTHCGFRPDNQGTS